MPAPRRAAIAAAALGVTGSLLLSTAGSTSAAAERRDASRPSAQQVDLGTTKNGGTKAPAKVISKDSAAFQAAVKPRNILAHLRQLQVVADRYGDRAAGREGYNASSRYVEAKLREAGYVPKRQYFDFTYSSVEANDFTAAGAPVDNTVLTGSPSTPDGGVTSTLVVPAQAQGCDAAAWNGVDATGKIALVSRGTCTFAIKSAAAKAAGAAGVVIYNNVATPFTGGTLGETTPDLAPTTGISQAEGQRLATAVAAGPVAATLDLDILVEQRRTWNVIAETSRGRTDNVVMMGAHLDGVQDGPGINDNGSGSATLLETAIQLKKFEKKIHNRVRFAWWGAEEIGLLGSTHWVNNLVATNPGALDDLAVYLNYDMVASPNYIIGVYDADQSTSPASAPVPAGSIETERTFRKFFAERKQPVVDTAFSGRSDYQAFIVNGVAAGGLFTGADGVKTEREVQLFGGRAGLTYDPNYHSERDSIANVNARALQIMTNAIAHMTIILGQDTRHIDNPSGRQAPKTKHRLVEPQHDHHDPVR